MLIKNKICAYSNALLEIPSDALARRSQVFIGTFCNYNCIFCYYKNKLHEKNEVEVLRQLDFVKDYGILDIEFTGGEPTIDPRWFEYLEYSQNKFRQIACITNGYKLSDKDFIKSSKEKGLKEVLFSLHGYDEESHDAIVGRVGAWKRIIAAIINAKELGLVVRLNCTVGSFNYSGLGSYTNLINEIQPDAVNFLPINTWHGANQERSYKEISFFIKRCIDKITTPFISVRFIPYCYMVDYEKYVCGWYQHPYDYLDWNNELNALPTLPTNLGEYGKTSFEYANKMRGNSYLKDKNCLKCKFFCICDGVQKEQYSKNPTCAIQGDLIKDPLLFRGGYYSEKKYKRLILEH